jgi:hypothetical protein
MYTSVFGDFANEKVEAFYRERLRQMSVTQRWQIVAAMRQIAINAVRAEVRSQHAEWSEQQVNLETTRRVLAANGYDFDPARRRPVVQASKID